MVRRVRAGKLAQSFEHMRMSLPRSSLAKFLVVSALAVLLAGPARTQVPNPLDDALQRQLQNQQAGQFQNADQLRPSVQIYQPVVPENAQVAPTSRLEVLYSARAGRPLTQFGYNILGVPTAVSIVQLGAIQDNYVLGEGDEIVIVLRGQESATYRQRVNRDGQIILPRLAPIPAAGGTLGDFRANLEEQVAQSYISTTAFVSLGEVRQISVLVTGEVRSPGLRVLTAMGTPLDALLLSGGIAKTGSLRNVALIRGNRTIPMDLYSLLTQGNLPEIDGLRNGDRIFVPPLAATVAVAGLVRRPGIYELRNGQTTMEAAALIQLAGGIEIGGNYRYSTSHLEPNGTVRLIPIAQTDQIASGEVLYVEPTTDVALDRVFLDGAVRVGGAYPRASFPTLANLLRNVDDLTFDAYSAFAVVVRRDPRLNVRTLIPFSLSRVMAGTLAFPLESDDAVYIFNRDEARLLADSAARNREPRVRPQARNETGDLIPEREPGSEAAPGTTTGPATGTPGVAPNGAPATPGLPAARTGTAGPAPLGGTAGDAGADLRLQATQQQVTAGTTAVAEAAQFNQQRGFTTESLATGETRLTQLTADAVAQRLGVPVQALVRTAADHLVFVLEEVRDPGPYLAADGATLADMLQTAGGVLRQADLSSVEITSTQVDASIGSVRTVRTAYKGGMADFQRVPLHSSDVIRLRPVFTDRQDGRVTLTGQVRYPGSFDITRGERLSSVIERAGGLTDQAYAFGAIFTRARAAITEREGNIRQAEEIEAQLAILSGSGNNEAGNADRIAFLGAMVQRLRDAPVLGRITTTADPALLRTRPELDVILEPGDTLYIPPRPSTITVAGEVLNSGTFQYEAGLTTSDYIRLAGGETEGADMSRAFAVFPDGSARPLRQSWLSFNKFDGLPPGSTIVIPRDLQPFNLAQFLRDATQIVSQLAITAASVAVINK